MKGKRRIKLMIDMVMTIMLPLIMAQLITGTRLHEWLGTVMIVLFLFHHILNVRWFPALFKGNYHAARSMGTAVNILLLADMLLLFISGIARSSYVFRALPQFMPSILSRRIHMTAGWWGFLLMSLHLGIHMRAVTASIGKQEGKTDSNGPKRKIVKAAGIVFRLLFFLFGICAFIRLQIRDYLFMDAAFAYYTDADRPALYFAEMICLMAGTAAAGFGLNEILVKKTSGPLQGD